MLRLSQSVAHTGHNELANTEDGTNTGRTAFVNINVLKEDRALSTDGAALSERNAN